MAVIATKATEKTVFTPTRISSFDLAGAFSRRAAALEATSQGAQYLKPSMLRQSHADYVASLGRISADSVVGAVAYTVLQFLNGGESLDSLTGKDVPKWYAQQARKVLDGMKPSNAVTAQAFRSVSGLIVAGIVGNAAPTIKGQETKKPMVTRPAPVTVVPLSADQQWQEMRGKAHASALAIVERMKVREERDDYRAKAEQAESDKTHAFADAAMQVQAQEIAACAAKDYTHFLDLAHALPVDALAEALAILGFVPAQKAKPRKAA